MQISTTAHSPEIVNADIAVNGKRPVPNKKRISAIVRQLELGRTEIRKFEISYSYLIEEFYA